MIDGAIDGKIDGVIDWQTRLIQRLHGTTAPDAQTPFNIAGIPPEQYAQVEHLLPAQRTRAAVLIPIIQRPEGLTVLFTQRATHLRRHAGQISFPGGRMESFDSGPLDTALRETEEEIGLSRQHVQLLGYLPPQLVFTGYCIAPVAGLVTPGFDLQLDASEVAEVFEAPLSHLLDPAHHQSRERQMGTITAQVYDIPYGERRIWGATAGILMSLYRLLKD